MVRGRVLALIGAAVVLLAVAAGCLALPTPNAPRRVFTYRPVPRSAVVASCQNQIRADGGPTFAPMTFLVGFFGTGQTIWNDGNSTSLGPGSAQPFDPCTSLANSYSQYSR
jgi:hypothetical protein